MAKTANIDWMGRNCNRNYPLHDSATRIDNKGNKMPTDILVDLHIWVPESVPSRLLVGSVGVSKNIASLTISAEISNSFSPVASIAVQNPEPFVNYELTTYVEGAKGWVSFGYGIKHHDRANWRFGSYSQTGILPKLSISYDNPAVKSIKKLNRKTGISGDILFTSGSQNTLIVEKVKRTINSELVDAIVFRLDESNGPSIYEKFVGPCDKSPESQTCTKVPIHAINNVTPDCDGNINIVMNEIVDDDIGPIIDIVVDNPSHTVVVDTALPLDDVCSRREPKVKNRQLVDYDDDCPYCPEDPLDELYDRPFSDYNWRFSPGA